MRTAVISDIHGRHRELCAVLTDIGTARCDRIVCLGDIVDGGNADAACLRELMARGVTTIRGNHDEIYMNRRDTPEGRWLAALPEAIEEEGIVFIHISPRRDDRPIADRYAAWNVLDDTRQRLAFIGHLHVPVLYGWIGAAVGAARQHPVRYGVAEPIDPTDRCIICPGAVGFPRDGDPAPRYGILDSGAATIEFRRVT